MNRGFTRMSPKVNSSRLYDCFKMSQIEQTLLAHKTLPRKWSTVFSEKPDMSQSYHWNNTEQSILRGNNHFFTSCLPRNQENLPQKTDHSSQRQCELSHIVSNICVFEQLVFWFDESPPYSPELKKNERSTFLDTWRSGWCVQNACLGDTLIRMAKVLRHYFQKIKAQLSLLTKAHSRQWLIVVAFICPGLHVDFLSL